MAACPRCRIELQYGSHGGWSAFGCTHCGGVWLDGATARTLMAPLTDLSISTDAARMLLRCPSCGSGMAPRVTAMAGVEIDQCPPHGVWFDHDELVKVSAAVSRLHAPPPPGHVAYANWGPATVAVGAAVGAAAVGAAAFAAVPEPAQERAIRYSGDAIEAAGYSVEATVDVADMVAHSDAGELVGGAAHGAAELAGGAAEGAAELAGGAWEVAGSVFEILGGLLEGLG